MNSCCIVLHYPVRIVICIHSLCLRAIMYLFPFPSLLETVISFFVRDVSHHANKLTMVTADSLTLPFDGFIPIHGHNDNEGYLHWINLVSAWPYKNGYFPDLMGKFKAPIYHGSRLCFSKLFLKPQLQLS